MRVATPGKVMLFGEYAVVEGRPALVQAVEVYATVDYIPGSEGVAFEALGLSPPVASTDDPRLGFLRAVVAASPNVPAGRYLADSRAFAAAGGKLGLGSSAAVTVAMVGAVRAASGEPPETCRAAVFDTALAAHRAASGGGSGADVAACTFGGLVRVLPTPGAGLEVEPRTPLPRLLLVATGVPADTRQLLAQVRVFRGRPGWDAALAELDAARAAGENALQIGEFRALREAVTRGREAMTGLAALTGAPLLGPPEALAQADRLAATFGGAVKTTGAGGGDLLWLALPADVPEAEVRAAAGPETHLWALAPGGGVSVVESP